MKKIYLLCNDKFSQSLYPWDGLSTMQIEYEFATHGIKSEVIDFNYIAQKGIDFFRGSVIVFGGSQNPVEKQVVEDYAYWLDRMGANIIPSYACLRSLENKGFQSLLNNAMIKRNNLDFYYNTSEKLKYIDGFVYKTPDGAGSNGVFLCKSDSDYKIKIIKILLRKLSISNSANYLKQIIKKIIRWRYLQSKELYYKPRTSLVLQEYIKGLSFDYKVLVFGSKYFVLKRNIAKKDFRASGSNLFEIIDEVPLEVLDFAKYVFNTLDTPYCSLDITINSNKETNLIEYQCTHFGPYTYLSAKSYFYIDQDEKWSRGPVIDTSLEKIYVDSIVEYIKSNDSTFRL
ncbi:hypothetical protein NGY2020029_32400 [Vibrio cholerae]|uniref:hypothetical protein n=1 Tax=Vibrio cholerae TaxID=666 RepID=UPI0002EC9D65|nr:hypothetical protein [Vibrio cholerae]ELQ6314216.1 hypothetical protein [Vibrio cholerae]KNH56318.1 hypothetical protein A55_4142 [Vibrio cholerae 1587]